LGFPLAKYFFWFPLLCRGKAKFAYFARDKDLFTQKYKMSDVNAYNPEIKGKSSIICVIRRAIENGLIHAVVILKVVQ
jgi:hypothetical protein